MNRLIWAVLMVLQTPAAWAEAVSQQADVQGANSPQSPAQEVVAPQVVAWVEGAEVLVDEYVYLVRKAVRERFYHGQVPEAELRSYRRELLDELIDSYLLAKEALRRELVPDMAQVSEAVQAFDSSASGQQGWAEVRAIWLARIEAIAVRASLKERLEQQVQAAVEPSEAEVLAYYQQHLDKFVTPEQHDVSTILLAVDPSSSAAVWQQANAKALQLKSELESGAVFEELAEIHSDDASAAAGGAMGLLHRGLLGGEVESALAAMAAGQISAPMRLLDGVVLLRLNARVEAQQRPFEEVRARAHGLLSREKGELAWKALQFRLRGQADIGVNEALLQKMGV